VSLSLYYPIAAEVVLFSSVVLIFYAYAGYPVLLFILSRFSRHSVLRDEATPRLSIIIAARNEQRDIRAKIESTLKLDYPPEKMEIIVTSDASSDDTDTIVEEYADRGVMLVRLPARQGKTRAQRAAVEKSNGQILVFTDATTVCEPQAIRHLVARFADPAVGCVAGQLVYYDGDSTAVSAGCVWYWSYEKLLKSWESRVGSLIGVSGSLYAVRRACYPVLPADMIDDLAIPSEVHLRGLRTVYEPQAVSIERTLSLGHEEFRMRQRIVEQTLRILHHYSAVLNPFRHGLFAMQMISHKLLRYCVSPVMVLALLSNAMLVHRTGFFLSFLCQCAFHLCGLAGFIGENIGKKARRLAVPYYLLLGNVAVLAAVVQLLQHDKQVTWEPIRSAHVPDGRSEASDN
jgi:cellulose synthase/poly-beta-1,6-N-acetylglucosamine synthase-like glycosyltransferase